MSVEGKVKEVAGFVKEEAYEHAKSAESQQKAQEGRDLRNEGRMEDGKAPKTTKPGTGHRLETQRPRLGGGFILGRGFEKEKAEVSRSREAFRHPRESTFARAGDRHLHAEIQTEEALAQTKKPPHPLVRRLPSCVRTTFAAFRRLPGTPG